VFTGLDLEFGPGAHALMGPNGSGKSTLLRSLAGALRPASGTVTIAGHDLARDPLAARRRLGYAPDETAAYPFMTPAELLRFVASAKGADIAADFVDALGLTPHLDQRFDTLSLGTQKKAMLAAAWIGDPAVLLLDEPGNGLDAAARAALVTRIVGAAATRTILFVTHDAELVAETGAHIIRMDRLVRRAA
jgi:heme-transporting ATPase